MVGYPARTASFSTRRNAERWAKTIEAEMISACSYIMEEDGVSCGLHGRRRPNGRVAKPYICTKWPDDAEVTHRGCALARRDQRPD